MKGQNYPRHGSRVDSEGRGSGNPQSPIRWGGGIVEGSNGEKGLQHGVGSPWGKRWRWREKEKAGVVSPSGGWKGPSIPKTLLMVPLLLKNSERLKSCVQKKKNCIFVYK